jgi:putative acetyltransferase
MPRPAVPTDLAEINELLDAAFAPSTLESKLVEHIFSSGEEYFAWVIEDQSRLTGVVVYTQAFREEMPIGYHLAPVAVQPEFQRRGIGSDLIQVTLNLPPLINEAVFVLGDPAYYERFGFARVTTALCPYDPSNEYFRALRWTEATKPFDIGYSPSFQVIDSANPSH